jgi:hypothetical protein
MKTGYLVLILLIGLAAVSANAGTITVSLLSPTLGGSPGDVLQFYGTLTNTTNADVFLNADNLNLTGFDPSAIDDSPFFTNAPLFLDPNGATGNIELFDVTIPDPFAAGGYDGMFEVLGGADGNAQDTLGSASFTVQVELGAAVPEPSSLSLVFSLMIFIAICRNLTWAKRLFQIAICSTSSSETSSYL